jgi:hypothetical protein
MSLRFPGPVEDPLTALPLNPLCLDQCLKVRITQVPQTPFVGYSCCPCCNAFALLLLVVSVAPIRIYKYPSTRIPPHIATLPQQ